MFFFFFFVFCFFFSNIVMVLILNQYKKFYHYNILGAVFCINYELTDKIFPHLLYFQTDIQTRLQKFKMTLSVCTNWLFETSVFTEILPLLLRDTK